MNIPTGHQTVMPYLMLKNARNFSDFVQTVFGAELLSESFREDGTTLMHAEIKIAENTIMFCEASAEYEPTPANLFIYVQNADKTFSDALSNGATIVNQMADQSYGRSGGICDPCGNTWWITSVK